MGYYISPKVELRESKVGGKGLFVKEKIHKGEFIVKFLNGPAKLVDLQEAAKLYEEGFDYMMELGDDLFLAATNLQELTDADHINHSCNPNSGIKGELKIIAMRDIEPDEEVTFDYAMTESMPYEMECKCGETTCRNTVTGDDWKRKDLQEKYRGFFSDHVQRKIDLFWAKRKAGE